ncbi:predicted protein [Scheffersomyces stipitis CBS 6054]|uniref:Uncharacterized protein n=1 Tax=Scheffersomyces stipitis (strain ATCC 58785 / CBS 6054 / NBRC 10063 / NRRL Y-11545) TaxID=322104 RepID=A3GHK8_PICST|nr:predicted protein [Scheffersomyces stipitis CBS 6054]EAZ62835.2 predicted protein [Scheffersomyces stipitis CBS 6054]KAG2735871.1 hypothetical protein G9P44_002085 [Scheffersomyces stipitis]
MPFFSMYNSEGTRAVVVDVFVDKTSSSFSYSVDFHRNVALQKMVLTILVPLSVKIAMTVGAVTGAAIAIANNKEKVLETAEFVFQMGADFCRAKLEEAKVANMHFADAYEDNEFASEAPSARSTGRSYSHETDDDSATTPETSDFSDDEMFYGDESDSVVELDVQSLD